MTAGGGGRRIVVLASSADEVALRLAARLGRPDVVVVTPADLSRPGWCYRPGQGASQIATADGILHADAIGAVVTRLPWVSELELPQIAAADRAYVAAEMGAFLLAWLSELACPVANRPAASCLCGPFWRHERWLVEAARAGLDVEPVRRSVAIDGAVRTQRTCVGSRRIVVVGEACLGDADAVLGGQALRLARATGVETLSVHFNDAGHGMRFLTANPWPCLEDDVFAAALLDHLAARSGVHA